MNQSLLTHADTALTAPDPVALLLADKRSPATQRASRADLRTLTIYDDNRSDFRGEVTGLLSRLL